MKKKATLTALVALLCALSLSAVPNNSRPAATVNLIRNTVITNAQLAAQMQSLGATEGQASDVLDIMINDEVFLQGAERDGISVSDTQLDSLYRQMKAQVESQAGTTLTDEQWDEYVASSYGTVAAYKTALKNQYIMESYLMQEHGAELQGANYAPTDAEVENFFRRNATSFTQAENVQFAQIYMSKTGDEATDSAKKAQMEQIAADIQSGKITFEAAVNQYTEDEASKATGGVMGWLSSDNTTVRTLWGDDFVDTVLSLELGRPSGVIESNEGYHIVRNNVHNDARLLGLEDRIQPDVDYTLRDYITELLAQNNQQTALANALNQMVADLRSEARIRVIYTPETT